jgi:toxin-antitoxin system PIN domain toxin
VTIIDVNVLLYAYYEDTPQHQVSPAWLESALERAITVGFPWVVIWGFLRVGTSRAWPRPKAPTQLFAAAKELLALPKVVVVEPGPRHAEILERLVLEYKISGPQLSDAVLAALAIENGATLASTDRDFSRFDELKWLNPLVP